MSRLQKEMKIESLCDSSSTITGIYPSGRKSVFFLPENQKKPYVVNLMDELTLKVANQPVDYFLQLCEPCRARANKITELGGSIRKVWACWFSCKFDNL
ncbi:hypothetical protein M8C21_006152 [Ambrosia artemisiifolia]|uniref:Uncharacterized protein n=1 Tax=Ambrosia artemisiifolia TaxID=4212 RepID=A0AAD5CT14_AMBAR|nr:hypothetical protein M8C21_006152 [Ambrosia artemisiifolia]